MNRYRRYLQSPAVLVVLLVMGLLVWQACSGSGDGNGGVAKGSPTSASTSPSVEEPATELEGILATTDLGVGSNRISFLLASPDALITVPEASVTPQYIPADGSPPVRGETVTARFHSWPFGVRGNYATELSFDTPGNWELDVQVQREDGAIETARIPIKVMSETITPAIGSRPPLTPNKILRDVEGIEELTSWPFADPEMYQLTIAEALDSGKPLMLVFASPGYCTTPTCGPQVDTIRGLKDKYKEQANFIHVEIYDNPRDVETDLRLGRYAAAVEAWNIPDNEDYLNESWVFIIDGEGRIAYKYEAYASAEELEADLTNVF